MDANALARILCTRSAQSCLRPDGRWHIVVPGPDYTLDYLFDGDSVAVWQLNNTADTPMTTFVSKQEDNVNAQDTQDRNTVSHNIK